MKLATLRICYEVCIVSCDCATNFSSFCCEIFTALLMCPMNASDYVVAVFVVCTS